MKVLYLLNHTKPDNYYPSATQCYHFIQSLILPVLLYNSELWFYSCTDGERTMLLSYFERANFDCDIHSVVCKRALKTAEKFFNDPEHMMVMMMKMEVYLWIAP